MDRNSNYSKIFWASNFETQRLISKNVLAIQDLLKESMESEEDCLESARAVISVLVGTLIYNQRSWENVKPLLEFTLGDPLAALESAGILVEMF